MSQQTTIETLTNLSVYLWAFSIAGFVTAYAVVVFRAILQKPLRAVATFVASFFL